MGLAFKGAFLSVNMGARGQRVVFLSSSLYRECPFTSHEALVQMPLPDPPKHIRFRETEQDLLAAFVTSDSQALAPNVFVLGYKSVGKTHVVLHHLRTLSIRHTVVNCDEFITQKILLQKCLEGIRTDSGVDLLKYHQKFTYKGREATRVSLLCETFAHFLMALEQFVEETEYREPHVLVLDRFDQCLDHTDGLLRSFTKFREYSSVRNITVVYIFSHEEPREVVTLNTPHVRFSSYSIHEVSEIMTQDPFPEVVSGRIDAGFWTMSARLVVDLFYGYTGSDIAVLREIFRNLWPKFLSLVERGSYGQNDFVAIYRHLKDEISKDDVITNSTVKMYENGFLEEICGISLLDLPYHSKFVLIAAYLASFTDQKLDVQLFSKMKTLKRRVNRKSSGIAMTKDNIDACFLLASFFDLERLRAILSVVYRNESRTLSRDNKAYFSLCQDLSERDLARKEHEFDTFTINGTVDLDTQIATLADLGLLSCTYSKDRLSKKIRWKCNVGWDVVGAIAREIEFPLLHYAIEK